MRALTKGANAPVDAGAVQVQVVCSSPVDVSALLLTASGRVRDDADMIFYNQPQGPGVQHRAAAGGAPARAARGRPRSAAGQPEGPPDPA